MATFDVEMSDGYNKLIHFAETAEVAMLRAEQDANEPVYVPYNQAAQVAAEGKVFRAEGKYLVRIKPIKALSAAPMRSVYMDGGYCCVPA